MNKKTVFSFIVFAVIIAVVLGAALKKDLLISYNDIIHINLYMYSYDIDTFNPDKAVRISDKNKIEEITTAINSEKVYKKPFDEHGMQNSTSGYIEIIYKNHLSETLYFSENKKSIYKKCNGAIQDYYMFIYSGVLYDKLKVIGNQ